MKAPRRWAGDPALAAGGIVLQSGGTPRIAVVRLRKRSEWVLPKGKLDDGETARQAAEREVLEETGHAVVVHEFLGTLAYVSGEATKAVHFWRMEADPSPMPGADERRQGGGVAVAGGGPGTAVARP